MPYEDVTLKPPSGDVCTIVGPNFTLPKIDN